MATENTNISALDSVAGELTDLIKQSSLAYQVCSVQYAQTPTPLLFGVRQKAGSKGFEVVQTTPVKFSTGDSEGMSEEVIDDVFNLFGDNAVEYIQTIAANEIADGIDAEIVTYLNQISTVDTTFVADFSTQPGSDENAALVQNLIIKINKTRLAIANSVKRGFPTVIIASGGVCALLLSHKMISNDGAVDANTSRSNVKYVGKIADANVFQDLNAISEYCMVTHNNPSFPGDSGCILVPITEPKFQLRRDSEGAGFTHHYKQRFAYGANPIDTPYAGAVSAVAQISTVTLSDFDAGDTIEIGGIGGTPTPVTCTTSITATVDLLVTEITNRTGETVTASNVGGVLTLTAITPGTAFTATATIVDLGTATVTVATIATPTPNVEEVIAANSDFTRKFACTLTGYDAI